MKSVYSISRPYAASKIAIERYGVQGNAGSPAPTSTAGRNVVTHLPHRVRPLVLRLPPARLACPEPYLVVRVLMELPAVVDLMDSAVVLVQRHGREVPEMR